MDIDLFLLNKGYLADSKYPAFKLFFQACALEFTSGSTSERVRLSWDRWVSEQNGTDDWDWHVVSHLYHALVFW